MASPSLTIHEELEQYRGAILELGDFCKTNQDNLMKVQQGVQKLSEIIGVLIGRVEVLERTLAQVNRRQKRHGVLELRDPALNELNVTEIRTPGGLIVPR